MIQFGKDILSDVKTATSREWLETNGLGGFSSSTVLGLNTRRYHGLLTAATKPPVGRLLMLSKLEETLVINGRSYELSSNQYPGVIHPRGYELLTGFRLDPFPVFTFQIEKWQLEKSVFMVQGQNTVVVNYELQTLVTDPNSLSEMPPREPIQLEIRPLIAFRDYHSTTHENSALNNQVDIEDVAASIKPYPDLPTLHFAHDPAAVDSNGFWYRNFEFAVERERGLDFREDLFSPFLLTFDLGHSTRARLIASTGPQAISDADTFRKAEISRRSSFDSTLPGPNEMTRLLASAAEQFIVQRGAGKTIIAGYHWFSDWGRDTMIALPGLTLATGRADVARSILAEFALHVDRGMLPNRFPDAGETPEYNTVDATLWFFEAVRSLLKYTNDNEFVRAKLYDVLVDIIDWHERGTRYNIHVDSDGLLVSGEPGVQLTWMDAKVGDWVVTPRNGKPVEIQALWYNALRVMEQLAAKFGDTVASDRYREIAERASLSFNNQFWNFETGCLYDCIDANERDGSVRPNQLLAISLEHSMLTKARAQQILEVVERELLTPRGLRTLPASDSRYVGIYAGGPTERDGSYHQGTVWPWLMGSFITAYVKKFKEDSGRAKMADWLENFKPHLAEACLGQVSEIFDANGPHHARGCAAQAWSVAELLRAAIEDVYVKKPSAMVSSG